MPVPVACDTVSWFYGPDRTRRYNNKCTPFIGQLLYRAALPSEANSRVLTYPTSRTAFHYLPIDLGTYMYRVRCVFPVSQQFMLTYS